MSQARSYDGKKQEEKKQKQQAKSSHLTEITLKYY